MTTPPTVLISYAHEGDAYLDRVKTLADRLRSRGLNVQLDQYEAGPPVEGWPRWMMKQVETCDFILCLCTPKWKRRYLGEETEDGGRGVTFEGLLITQGLYDANMRNRRIIPLTWPENSYEDVPSMLRPWVQWRLPSNVDDVIAHCLGERPFVPAVGEPVTLEAHALTIDVALTATNWTLSALDENREVAAPEWGDLLPLLRRAACAAIPCDADGRPETPQAAASEAALRDLARRVGEKVSSLLPPAAIERLRTLMVRRSADGAPLLRIRSTHDAPLRLPWEVLLLDGEHPVQLGKLEVAREVHVAGAPPLEEQPEELRVVAHIAAPQGKGVVELDLEQASFRMAMALDGLLDRTRFTEMGTLQDLEAAAEQLHPTLLHYSGHGSPGHLVFEDELGGPAPVAIPELLKTLRRATGGSLPRAVWLSCCYGAGGTGGTTPAAASRDDRDWHTSQDDEAIAARLHREGIPVVLGYFGPVPDPLAVEVDAALFEQLRTTGRTRPAVHRARQVAQQVVQTSQGALRFPLAWALLVLYLRGPDRALHVPDVAPEALRRAVAPESLSVGELQALDHGFVGRRRLLARLRLASREHQALGLYGLGGLGKTATVLRLARVLLRGRAGWQDQVVAMNLRSSRAQERFSWLYTKVVGWLKGALAHERIDAELVAVDEAPDRGAALARLLLRRCGDRVLLLDNAETLQLAPTVEGASVGWVDEQVTRFMQTLMEAPPTRVLMTTRYRPASTKGGWLEIDVCSDSETFRMTQFRDTLRRLPLSLRAELARERLVGHPRAVEWVDRLVGVAEAAAEEDGELEGALGVNTPVKVARAVVERALRGLQAEVDADLALGALLAGLEERAGSLLGEATGIGLPVPWTVVQQLGTGAGSLKTRGLLTRYGDEGRESRWAVHPFVVEAVTRWRGGPGWTKAGRWVLGEYWFELAKVGAPAPVWREAVDQLAAAEAWDAAAKALVTLSNGLRHQGQVRARHELLEQVGAWAWPGAAEVSMLLERADARLALGFLADAEVDYSRAVAAAEAVFGTREHASVAASLHGLANVLTRQGKYAEAKRTYNEAVDIKFRVVGTREHADVAASLHGLANVLNIQGKYAEAERTYNEAVDIKFRVFDTREHADVAASLAGLGNVLNRQGKYAEAERTYNEAVDITVRVLGTREHADVAASLAGLGNVLNRQGKYAEAERTYNEAVDITVRVLGTREHADVAASLHGLANVLDNQGKYAEAERTYNEAVDIKVRVFGTRVHADVTASLHGLANVQTRQGKYAEAERTYNEVVDIEVRVFGTRVHASVAASLHGLASVLSSQGKYTEAERSLREVVDIEAAAFGSRRTPTTLVTLLQLALLVGRGARTEEALALLHEAWTGAVEHRSLVDLLRVGPTFRDALRQAGRAEEASQVEGMVRSVLAQLPAGHPLRQQAEQQLGEVGEAAAASEWMEVQANVTAASARFRSEPEATMSWMHGLAEASAAAGAMGPSCSYLTMLVQMLRAVGQPEAAAAAARVGLERAQQAGIAQAVTAFEQLLSPQDPR